MQPIWVPSAERVAGASVTRFITCLNARKNLRLANHGELYAWSVAHPGEFWSELARFADVRAIWGTGAALENAHLMPGARFFPTARLNFAENLLR
ncbi:MAG TPA: acetyl-coenzyme A synthetase N-terminal domain-containing protein, partial [Steroidobacteraceae bacterium]|nr:acetyl-coenzyme A synthetase N-terminal domain-containing protein [Steroidobacteraceae bacterium]